MADAEESKGGQCGCCAAGLYGALFVWPPRIAFMLVFLLATLPCWLYAVVVDCCCCCLVASEEARRRHGRFLGWFVSTSWRLAFRFCCWIRIEASTDALKEAGTKGRSAFIAANHVSFMDTPLFCTALPGNIAGDTKTLMARMHLNMPVIGRLARFIGHMPVPFTSERRGNLSVDKERMAETMALVDAHIDRGGHLVLFPEGDLNSQWRRLKQFRAGGLEICVRHDMEVWAVVMAGTANCWPEGAPCGGSPATLAMRAVLLYPSAKSAAEELAGSQATLREQAVALAENMRERMQAVLDELAPLCGEPSDSEGCRPSDPILGGA